MKEEICQGSYVSFFWLQPVIKYVSAYPALLAVSVYQERCSVEMAGVQVWQLSEMRLKNWDFKNGADNFLNLGFLPKFWLHAICYLYKSKWVFFRWWQSPRQKSQPSSLCSLRPTMVLIVPMLDLVFGTYKRTDKEWIDVNDARYKKEMVALGGWYRCWPFQKPYHQVIILCPRIWRNTQIFREEMASNGDIVDPYEGYLIWLIWMCCLCGQTLQNPQGSTLEGW